MSTVVVDPITRIEGHLRIEAKTNENGVITDAMSAGTMVRGIETILQGRDPRDAWAFTQRICGVCTSSHAITSVRAVEDALGIVIPENARDIRNLIDGAQFVHDHVVHFYHLHALDWVDVVSALDADPAATAVFQKCILDQYGINRGKNNDWGYFDNVKTKLRNFVNSGQLGIFKNGYWGHPEYKLPAEINLMAVAHYLEALTWQRNVARLHAVFGGKNPHPSFIVGGVPCAVSAEDGMTRLDQEGFDIVGEVLDEMQEFVNNVYVPDVLTIAPYYKDWFSRGEGIGNFLTFGDFPLVKGVSAGNSRGLEAGDLLIPRGAILNRDLSVVHPVDLHDFEQVTESVASSWYDYSAGKDTPLHPYVGETKLNYTGPTPPYEHLDIDQSYSWVKAPRWRGKAMEVGPLAHILMLYATGHEKTRDMVDKTLTDLKLPIDALYSTMGRTAARTLEAKLIADEMGVWFKQLKDRIFDSVQPDLSMHNNEKFDPSTWPAEARGAGYLEAPRGALGHWVVIKNGKIANYQTVVPTTWNASPRTYDKQKTVLGAYEAALIGHHLADPKQPLEILRTIHSFDPCMGCAVHLMDEDGDELLQVKVL